MCSHCDDDRIVSRTGVKVLLTNCACAIEASSSCGALARRMRCLLAVTPTSFDARQSDQTHTPPERGNIMNRILGTLVTLSGLALAQSAALADHNYGSPYSPQQSYHDGLAQRSYDRQSVHSQAHNFGMSYGQHNSLHHSLSHQANRDNRDHRAFDRTYGASSFGGGYGSPIYGYGAGSVYSQPGGGSCGNGGAGWSPRW